jgi:RNA polymerase sigma factor (sigma-70 family)
MSLEQTSTSSSTPPAKQPGDVAANNARWVRGLGGEGAEHEQMVAELYRILLRVSTREAQRRGAGMRLSGPELDDVAHQAASDATLAICRKVETFRGDCRFTTWAYRFVVFEVASKINRHPWRRPTLPLHDHEWNVPSADVHGTPGAHFERQALSLAFQEVFHERLTKRQKQAFDGIAIRGLPVSEVARELGSNPNAVYKTMFDARKKLREGLIDAGFLDDERRAC